MNPRYAAIPEELRELPNWIVWRLEKVVDKRGILKTSRDECDGVIIRGKGAPLRRWGRTLRDVDRCATDDAIAIGKAWRQSLAGRHRPRRQRPARAGCVGRRHPNRSLQTGDSVGRRETASGHVTGTTGSAGESAGSKPANSDQDRAGWHSPGLDCIEGPEPWIPRPGAL